MVPEKQIVLDVRIMPSSMQIIFASAWKAMVDLTVVW